MKLDFGQKNKEKILKLFETAASEDRDKSFEGLVALAALAGPVIDQVIPQLATHRWIYDVIPYNMNDGAPTIPIDPYFGNTEGALKVWSQNMPGGLASNLVSGGDEYRFTTHTINSAISFLKKYIELGRLDVFNKGIEKLTQELLLVTEFQAWFVLLSALANATTDSATHLISATTAGVFTLDDLNRLMTKAKRIRKSWVGGTPVAVPGQGITDLFVSPEVIEDIRAMAYQPMNTRAGSLATSGATAVPLPDEMRLEAWRNAGAPSFFGVTIHEMQEFGVAQVYSQIFDQVYSGSPAFAQNSQELVLGVDLSLDCAVMVEATDRAGVAHVTKVDDQFPERSKKVGFYTEWEGGFMVADNKSLVGLVV